MHVFNISYIDDMMFLNMYETDNDEDEEYVESLPESYSEEDLKAMEEAKKQKEEQLKVWKEKMQQNAMMFLSDTGVIVRHRRKREIVDNFWRKHHKLVNSRIRLIINDFIMISVLDALVKITIMLKSALFFAN